MRMCLWKQQHHNNAGFVAAASRLLHHTTSASICPHLGLPIKPKVLNSHPMFAPLHTHYFPGQITPNLSPKSSFHLFLHPSFQQHHNNVGFVAAASMLLHHTTSASFSPHLGLPIKPKVLNSHPMFAPLQTHFFSSQITPKLSLKSSFHLLLSPKFNVTSIFFTFTRPLSAKAKQTAKSQALLLHPKKKKQKPTPFESLTEFLSKVRLACEVAQILQKMKWDAGLEKALKGLKAEWDPILVLQVLRYYPLEVEVAWRFFVWLRGVQGYKHNPYTYSTMLEIFGRANNVERVGDLLKEMAKDGIVMNVLTCTRLMYWYGRAGDMDKALGVFDQMKAGNCKPNIVTYMTLMHLYSKEGNYAKLREIYLEMVDCGELPNSAAYTVLINCLAQMNKLDAALRVFDSMEKVNVVPSFVTYGVLMNAFAKAGNVQVLRFLYDKMQSAGVWLNQKVYSSLVDHLHAAGKLEEADDLIKKFGCLLEKEGHGIILPLQASAKEPCKEEYGLQEVLRAFDGQYVDKELEDPFGACLFTSYPQDQDFSRANLDIRALCGVLLNWDYQTAEALDAANIKWDHCSVLRMLIALKSGDVARRFSKWVRDKQGYEPNIYTYSKMIYILARDGHFKSAEVLLEEMKDKKLPIRAFTFNTLLSFVAAAGILTEALKLFYRMKEFNVAPDTSTFTLLIDMFVKHNRNDKALDMYKRMLDSGLTPDTGTYSSFIKSLTEEGKVEAAYSIFQKMQEVGCRPDLPIFTALIEAFYKKDDMGKTLELFSVTEEIGMELLPSSYRVVAKAFKRVGKLEEANKIREEKDLLAQPNPKKINPTTIKEIQNTILEAFLDKENSENPTCSEASVLIS